MIDWALSKMIMSAMAIALMVFSFVFFEGLMDDEQSVDIVLDDLTEHLAQRVAKTISFRGTVRYNFTYHAADEVNGNTLPRKLNDGDYKLYFTRSSIKIACAGQDGECYFSEKNALHLFSPTLLPEVDITSRALDILDSTHFELEMDSGENFVLENVPLFVDGEFSYLTFLYSSGVS